MAGLLVAIRQAVPSAQGISQTVLHDVQHFLERRGFEYFSGFREDPVLSLITAQDAAFYDPVLFAERAELRLFPVEIGEWAQ